MNRYLTTPIAFIVVLAMMTTPVLADSLTQITDRLNFQTSQNHNTTIAWTGATSAEVNATFPASFTFVSALAGCSNVSTTVTCSNVASGSEVWYVISSPSGATEYQTYTLVASTNTSVNANNVTLVRVDDNEIFYTLVEFGRGRGNYFYATNSKAKGKNLTCNSIPENTDMELNFLHKVTNIGRYIGLPGDVATEANWTCEYPDKTVIRHHNVDTMTKTTKWTTNYNIEEVETSWERMGYLSMQIDSGEYAAGAQVSINCTNMEYAIDSGEVVVVSDNFTLNVVDREPITVTAFPSAATVNNGTTLVEITYQIENAQSYDLEGIAIELQAPESATFIGVRGELWGTSEDYHIIEFNTLDGSESKNVTLVARFDTADQSPADTTLSLSLGADTKFLTCWEKQAYNPTSYVQAASVSETLTWSQGATSAVTDLITKINEINDLAVQINTTTIQINTTANTLETYLIEVNTTTHNISDDLQTTVIPNLETIKGYTDEVEGLIADAIGLLDCTNMSTGTICWRIDQLNDTVTEIEANVTEIINDIDTLNTNMGNNFTAVFNRFDAVDGNLTEIDNFLTTMNITVDNTYQNTVEIIELLDCSNSTSSTVCDKLDNITNIVANMNVTVQNIEDIVIYINGTRWNNLTANDLYDKFTEIINQLNTNTTEILKRVRLHKEFSEEMVFLITDSINSQVSAQRAVDNKDLTIAVTELKSAQNSLSKANLLLAEEAKDIQSETGDASDIAIDMSLLVYAIAGMLVTIVALGIYFVKGKKKSSDAVPIEPMVRRPAIY